MLRLPILLLAGFTAFAQQYTISTAAGGAPPATPVSATSASIGQPQRVKVVGSNIYFSAGNSVFRMDSAGTLTLIAGNSRAGFSGDGGAATNAQLNSPQGIAVDAAGNVYIADSLNNRVRKVDTKGVITTFAGNGGVSQPGFWGDGGPAVDAQLHSPVAVLADSAGKVYIAAAADNTVRVVGTDGNISIYAGAGYKGYYGDTGKANVAGITSPQDVTLGPNNTILIADTGAGTIRSVATDGTISTVSGNGSIGLAGDAEALKLPMLTPFGVSADSQGNIYVAEFGTNRIRKIDSKGMITTAVGDGNQGFAGDGGPPNKVQMSLPTSVSVDSGGNVYFVDSQNNRIRKLAGGNVTTVAGNGLLSRSGDGGAATSAQLNTPLGVAVDAAGNLYIADSVNNVVRRVAASGQITTFAGTGTVGSAGDGSAATSAQLNGPQGLAVDGAGNLYIADTLNHRVRKVTNGTISTLAGSGTAGFGGDGAGAGAAQLNLPFGVAVDGAGIVYIAEFGNNRVRKVAANGTITTLAGNGAAGFSGDGGAATSAMLNTPQAVAADSAGNVYIGDSGNNRVRKVATNGSISTFAGNGVAGYDRDGVTATSTSVGNPNGLAVDASGSLYITDGSARVRKVPPSGIIATIAGVGSSGYSGDGGAASNARLDQPSAVAVAGNGNVYVADTGNNAVRVLQATAGGISITAIVNGASNQAGAIAPGEVVAIYGSGLGPAQLATFSLTSAGLVPTSVAGTSVFFNNIAAPVLYTSANQVGAIVPFGISGPQAQVAVIYQGQQSSSVVASVATTVPGIFTSNAQGTGQAAAVNQDGSINSAARPVKISQVISLYVTGAGQTNPAGADGQPAGTVLPVPVLGVKATVGGRDATVQYAGGALNLVAGVIQVNVVVPTGVTPGAAVPVVVQVGTSNTQAGVTIAVSN